MILFDVRDIFVWSIARYTSLNYSDLNKQEEDDIAE